MKHSSNAKTVIRIENLDFSYNGNPVLQDVNLEIHEQEMIGIVGPNGGGKTTLLRLILGLLKPDSGQIEVFGEAPARSSHRLGYVPHHMQFDKRFPVSVRDVVLMGLAGKGGFGPAAVLWRGLCIFWRRGDRKCGKGRGL